MRWQSRVAVPLKAMCSTTWLMPLCRRGSCRLPVRTKTLRLAVSRQGIGSATARKPLARVKSTGAARRGRSGRGG